MFLMWNRKYIKGNIIVILEWMDYGFPISNSKVYNSG